MRDPDFLKKNDVIGFVAPSFGCSVEPYFSGFSEAKKRFRRMGYRIEQGPNCLEDKGIGKSNTPEKCAEELNEMYCSESNRVLISCGGGELMCEDLNYLDFDRIKAAKPKWYMGYSDNTNFTYTLTTICDVASVYGPCAAAFGMRPWHKALRDAFGILEGKTLDAASYDLWQMESLKDEEHPFEPYNLTMPVNIIGIRPDGSRGDVTAKGRLIGGCMDILINLLGTEFDHTREFVSRYAADGILWYLESCDLTVLSMRRAMWQMKNAGWFEHASGFIFGRPLHYGEKIMGLDQYNAVTEPLKDLNVPVILDADIGHLPPMMPLINGSIATASVKDEKLAVHMELR